MNKDLLKVSIRQNAIYLPLIEEEKKQEELTSTTIALVAQLRKVGYACPKNCCMPLISYIRLNR